MDTAAQTTGPPVMSQEQIDAHLEALKIAAKLEVATVENWRTVLEEVQDDLPLSITEQQPVTPGAVNELAKNLTLFLARKAKEQEIPFQELPDIANYIVTSLSDIQVEDDIGDFLYLLQARWPLFAQFTQVAVDTNLSGREQIEQLAKLATT